MPNNNKVLVVSEDPGLRRDLVTILEFLGEGPVAADDLSVAAQLQDGEGQPEGFSVAVLAGDGQALRDSLQELARIAPALPVLLAGGPEAADLPRDLASRIIARLEWPLNYAKFVDSLHRAQVYRSQFDQGNGRGHQRGV